MRETVLIKSGDLFFSRSAEGCNTSLPSGKKIWLNDQIIDMYQQIQDLSGSTGKDGKDGRDVELKVGIWPEGAPDLDENYFLQWRWKARQGDIQEPWKYLIRMIDMKGQDGLEGPVGPAGPEGPRGPTGIGVEIKGAVTHVNELFSKTGVKEGDGWMENSTGYLWRCNNGYVWDSLIHWDNLGRIVGPTGARGPKGDRGPKGEKGAKGADGGGVSEFVVQWIVNSATSAAISGVMNEVSSMVNDAINDAINQLMSEMENMVTDAVEKAVSDALEDIKGEKGDKGDKGDKGKDGKSVRMVGKYETLTRFTTLYPAEKDNVGIAALIGKDGEEKVLWAITETPSIGGLPAHYTYEELGDIRGPQGEAATWTVSIRDKDFVQKGDELEVESDLPSGVAGMYIQESNSVIVEGVKGSAADAKQVGIKLSMKYPIPKLVKEGDATGVPTKGKVLGNDGEKLEWVDGGTGGGASADEILLKGEDDRMWSIRIDDNGRLYQELSVQNTDKNVLKVKSPNGVQWGITIDNTGRLNISGVI